MALFNLFKEKESTASVAKERLKVIVAHERSQRNQPDYLPALQQDILEVLKKYIPMHTTDDSVDIRVENEGNYSVLELNITLPE